jgi:hypothetical protein
MVKIWVVVRKPRNWGQQLQESFVVPRKDNCNRLYGKNLAQYRSCYILDNVSQSRKGEIARDEYHDMTNGVELKGREIQIFSG